MKKYTVSTFRKMKQQGEKIVMLTAYDAPTAAAAAAAGIDILLVGDSMANTVLGYKNTLALTLDQSLHHCCAVRRGAPDAFIIGDMPFLSFHTGERDAVLNAGRYLQEAECDAVKIEGGAERAGLIATLVECGIPVCAHIGLMPQKVMTSGGYKIAGRDEGSAARLLADAKAVQEAGAFMVVFECMPAALAESISTQLDIPTIGIGAGVGTDGQVQVVHDLLGLLDGFVPKHARQYVKLHELISRAMKEYVADVKKGDFPGPENSF